MKNYRIALRSISIKDAICFLVETALPRFTPNQVMVIPIKFDVENYNTDKHFYKMLNFVFYRPANYTFVGTFEDSNIIPTLTEETLIIQRSDHDSCWRDDGVEHSIGLMANQIEKKIEKSNDWDVSVSFGLLNHAQMFEGKINTSGDIDVPKFFVKSK